MEKLLTLASISKKEFEREYRRCYYRQPKAGQLYLQVLTELQRTIAVSNITSFKKLCTLIDCISSVESKAGLRSYHESNDNPFKGTNVVLFACKHNNLDILKCILDPESKILNNFSVGIGKSPILPTDTDDALQDTFYYALRASNVELLGTLIDKWPEDYFANHLEELDALLADAHEKLKLKNVVLSEEMELCVADKLITLRFFSDKVGQPKKGKISASNIEERINLVTDNISLLNEKYSNADEEIDGTFVFVSKFIAKNIHVLKQQLQFSYDMLPWEEIEFCLIIFIASCTKQQEINVFYRSVLNKETLLKHLKHFAKRLEEVKNNTHKMDVHFLATFPKLKREEVAMKIINTCPQFEELYRNYHYIRDVCSLDIMKSYLEQALSADSETKQGQFVIIRSLQVIGDCLNTSLQYPNISSIAKEHLLLSLPNKTRKLILELQASFSNRKELDENADGEFFAGIQNDLQKISIGINDIQFYIKIKTIKNILQKFVISENLDELKEIGQLFKDDPQLFERIKENSKLMEYEKIQNCVEELGNKLNMTTRYEETLFNKINDIIDYERTKSDPFKMDYTHCFKIFQSLLVKITDNEIYIDCLNTLKYSVEKSLKYLDPQLEANNYKRLSELSTEIVTNVEFRVSREALDEMKKLISQILFIYELGTNDIKWTVKLNEKLSNELIQKKSLILLPKETCSNKLDSKLFELKNIFKSYALTPRKELLKLYSTYKTNKKLNIITELLVLDILSILDNSRKCPTENQFYLDNSYLLLTGKCLYNYLAHHNYLNDILSDPSIIIFLNAYKLCLNDTGLPNKTFGKNEKENICKIKENYQERLGLITNQEALFKSLEKGNLEKFKNCVKKGADVNARNVKLWTTLHFAAKGCNLSILKYILNQNVNIKVKDISGRNPLHIAASYGRTSVVKFFVENGLSVFSVDNNGQTPLHIAAQKGHTDTVQMLLKHKSLMNIQTKTGFAPLHYAIQRNHRDVIKVLLTKEITVDMNETNAGYTPLHLAAGRGYLELVDFLLQNGANSNASSYHLLTPLHKAVMNEAENLQVVKLLISKGASINAKCKNNCTALHFAVEEGHEEIVKALLKDGANVNGVETISNSTPLLIASRNGHEGIVKLLLQNNANTNVVDNNGNMPLRYAVYKGYLGIVMALLRHSAKTDNSLLLLAAEKGHKDIIELLIKNGDNVDTQGMEGITALHKAAFIGRKDVVTILLKNSADASFRNDNGFTPLHLAASNGQKHILDILIKSSANVNSKDVLGFTPLHLGCMKGHVDVVEHLLQRKSNINATAIEGYTPLSLASLGGHKDVVKLLIRNKARVNNKDHLNNTALHKAIEFGDKEIVNILIDNGAQVNVKNKKGITPLFATVEQNNKEILKFLIEKGTDLNAEGGDLLIFAIMEKRPDIVRLLLEKNIRIRSCINHKTLLSDILSTGVDACQMKDNITPLHLAACYGQEEVVQILIANGANVNSKTAGGSTPLHTAAIKGSTGVFEVLLHNKAKVNVRDKLNMTPIVLAVTNGFLDGVKMLLEYKEVNINVKGNLNYTLLHIAAEEGYFEIVQYLISKGADVNARTFPGLKPIHVAAQEGHVAIVKFFLEKGLSVNELGSQKLTVLHYASKKNNVETVNMLLKEGADVNAGDITGTRPLHLASLFGREQVVVLLINNGAFYNITNNSKKNPLDIAHERSCVKDYLESTKNLFEAVKGNDYLKVQSCLDEGAYVNAKNSNNVTPLHYASWKGFEKIVDILLDNGAEPNTVGKGGSTPLHYAAKFAHFKIVKTLLISGAIYNARADDSKTPLDFAEHQGIIYLLTLLDKSFQSVKNNLPTGIENLLKEKDADTMNTIMNAHDTENKKLIDSAMINNFSKIDKLKEIMQGDVHSEIKVALYLLNECKFEEALSIFNNAYNIRKTVLGPDNPGTLDIQVHIAKTFCSQREYQKALCMAREIFQMQKEILGPNNKDTLNTANLIGLVLKKQGQNEEAFKMYHKVYQKKRELLGMNHLDTLEAQFQVAAILAKQEKYQEALLMNQEVINKRRKALGINDPSTLSVKNKIAKILLRQGRFEAALKNFKEVLNMRSLILGTHHADTLKTTRNIAATLQKQERYHEASKVYEEILDIQLNILGKNHSDTLKTQYNLGHVLYAKGNFIAALEIFETILNQRNTISVPSHPSILDTLKKIRKIKFILNINSSGDKNFPLNLQKEMHHAAGRGDEKTVQILLNNRVDANYKDKDGRTALHYAVNDGHLNVVNILLENGADVTQITNKGNTPLHTAASEGYKDIVEILLQNVSGDKLNDFLNAQTTAVGTASLHVAAKKGSLEIVKVLLKYGAIYNIMNKERKTPMDLSSDNNVSNLLKTVETIFQEAKKGSPQLINSLQKIDSNDLSSVTNARDRQGKSLIQVTIINSHTNLLKAML